MVTVEDGSGGVRTTLQITSANGTTPLVELELRSDVETTQSETSAFVSTLEIPTDAEIATLPANAELEVEIQGGDLDAAVTLTVSTGGFSSATALASQLQSQLLSEITAQHPESQISVTVDTAAATSTSGVSLVLQSSAGPITTDIDFETTSFSTTGSQSFASVDLPSEISQGDELGLEVTGSGAAVNLTQTVADGETIEQVADRLVADLVSTSAGDLSAEVVTVDDGSGGVRTTLQITSANGTTPLVELELRSDVETTQSETSAFVSTLEIPTDAEIATLPANAELEVEIQGGDLDAAVTLTVSTGGFSSATALASQLQSQLLSEITAQHPDSQISVTVDTAAATSSGVALVLQSSAGVITTDIDFETTSTGTTGTQSFASVDLPSELSPGDELELNVTGSGAPVNLTQTVGDGETIEQVADLSLIHI